MKDTAERLMDILAEITHSDERADDAYQLAGQLSYELDEAKSDLQTLLRGIQGMPAGATHIMLCAYNVGYSYSCRVDILRLHDGVWYRHSRDSDDEYPQFSKVSEDWLAANQEYFVKIPEPCDAQT